MRSGVPPGRPIPSGDDPGTDNGGGFINIRYDDPSRSALPRSLTDEEKAALWEAVAPLLRDMMVTGQAPPDIREEAHEDLGEDAVCAWIREPGGRYGQGVRVWLNGSPAFQLYSLAEQMQDWAGDVQLDPGRRPWPGCPEHPGSHMLGPDIRDDVAVWCCPDSGHVIAAIGTLT
jgi:hypothetical protein